MELIHGPKRWKQFIKSSIADLQDPVFLTFDLNFLPDDYKTGEYQQFSWNCLFKDQIEQSTQSLYNTVEWSAIDWLTMYGSDWTKKHATDLIEARKLLKELQESPWYFQSIMGLDSLWKAASRVKDGDKIGEITINCIDSIEQPLLRFAEYYRSAIYDQDKLAYTLPDNLRMFDMVVRLFEIRDIVDPNGRLKLGIHQLSYRLQRCEFDFDSIMSSPQMTELKVYTSDTPFTTSFKVKVGWVIEEPSYQVVEDYYSLGIFSGVADSLTGRIQQFVNSALTLPTRIVGDISNVVQTKVENYLAQNVYDRQTEVLDTNQLFNRQSPIGPISTSIGTTIYESPDNPDISNLGNPYI